jgi:toxin FitB
VYLVDTDVISESRRGSKANSGVRSFFRNATADDSPLYLSVISLGELRRGIEILRHRREKTRAVRLERWLNDITVEFGDLILPFDEDAAHIWGRLRVPHPENAMDKQIAATALIHDLIVVTRNGKHYQFTGVNVLNPFT